MFCGNGNTNKFICLLVIDKKIHQNSKRYFIYLDRIVLEILLFHRNRGFLVLFNHIPLAINL